MGKLVACGGVCNIVDHLNRTILCPGQDEIGNDRISSRSTGCVFHTIQAYSDPGKFQATDTTEGEISIMRRSNYRAMVVRSRPANLPPIRLRPGPRCLLILAFFSSAQILWGQDL